MKSKEASTAPSAPRTRKVTSSVADPGAGLEAKTVTRASSHEPPNPPGRSQRTSFAGTSVSEAPNVAQSSIFLCNGVPGSAVSVIEPGTGRSLSASLKRGIMLYVCTAPQRPGGRLQSFPASPARAATTRPQRAFELRNHSRNVGRIDSAPHQALLGNRSSWRRFGWILSPGHRQKSLNSRLQAVFAISEVVVNDVWVFGR